MLNFDRSIRSCTWVGLGWVGLGSYWVRQIFCHWVGLGHGSEMADFRKMKVVHITQSVYSCTGFNRSGLLCRNSFRLPDATLLALEFYDILSSITYLHPMDHMLISVRRPLSDCRLNIGLSIPDY